MVCKINENDGCCNQPGLSNGKYNEILHYVLQECHKGIRLTSLLDSFKGVCGLLMS